MPIGDPRPILTSIGVVVYDWDIASDRIAWGANAADILGLTDLAQWSTGRDLADRVEDIGASRHEVIHGSLAVDEGSGVPYRARYGLRVEPGRLLRIEDGGRWFADRTGRPARAHGIMRIGQADAETIPGFREREALLRLLAAQLSEGRRTGRPVSIAAIAVRNLAEINDSVGYDEAEQVLAVVGERLHRVCRQQDQAIRYAGNRFAVLLRGCAREQVESAVERLSRLIETDPVETPGGSIPVALAVGAATCPDHAPNATGLFRRAEQALGLAKKRSGGRVTLFDPGALRAAVRTEEPPPQNECAAILNERRITFASQPIAAAGSRQVAFEEALLRVDDVCGRVVPAADIVPHFERAGLIHLADARMLELVIGQLESRPLARMALNVSPLTLATSGDWSARLAAHLAGRPDLASRLIIEVTETAAIENPMATRRQLEEMKALGVAIAIDDFGAGHTSFRHLRNFPVDLLKIDGAFVQNLPRQPSDGFFVRTLIDLARHLGIATVAEWVEDEETAALLTAWGIDYLQGDFIGSPVAVAGGSRAPLARSA